MMAVYKFSFPSPNLPPTPVMNVQQNLNQYKSLDLAMVPCHWKESIKPDYCNYNIIYNGGF